VLAAAYFGVEPLPSVLCEIPVETVAAAGEWLRRRPEVRCGRVGLVGGSKGAELALLAATAYPDLFGPVVAIAPSCVTWFGVDLTRGVADASARSSWTLGDQPVSFVPPVPGVGFERTERGLRTSRIAATSSYGRGRPDRHRPRRSTTAAPRMPSTRRMTWRYPRSCATSAETTDAGVTAADSAVAPRRCPITGGA
jgi:pimeloyl-ACP methyl ester carboxylesterase